MCENDNYGKTKFLSVMDIEKGVKQEMVKIDVHETDMKNFQYEFQS